MIVVDTSALMAVVKGEPEAGVCIELLAREPQIVTSAATIAEALVVARLRNVDVEMTALLNRLEPVVIPVNEEVARKVAAAYARWGKGVHPAHLNFGDCFAYVTAMEHDCPLLFVGNDFAQTDVRPAIAA